MAPRTTVDEREIDGRKKTRRWSHDATTWVTKIYILSFRTIIIVRENRAKTHIVMEPILPHHLNIGRKSVVICAETSNGIDPLKNDVAYALSQLTDG